MGTTNVEPVSNWKGVLAAMLYLTAFLTLSYSLYAVVSGASFLDSLALALPRALLGSVALYTVSAVIEAVRHSIKVARSRAKPVQIQTLAHR